MFPARVFSLAKGKLQPCRKITLEGVFFTFSHGTSSGWRAFVSENLDFSFLSYESVTLSYYAFGPFSHLLNTDFRRKY